MDASRTSCTARPGARIAPEFADRRTRKARIAAALEAIEKQEAGGIGRKRGGEEAARARAEGGRRRCRRERAPPEKCRLARVGRAELKEPRRTTRRTFANGRSRRSPPRRPAKPYRPARNEAEAEGRDGASADTPLASHATRATAGAGEHHRSRLPHDEEPDRLGAGLQRPGSRRRGGRRAVRPGDERA